MKFVAIVGSNADQSYNRLLLQFMQGQFSSKCDIELLEIKDVPMFNQDDDQSDCVAIRYLNDKIVCADGVIIATPEHNHTIPPALKSTLEWLSYKLHPLDGKPVMIVGASYYDQGTSRAQVHLRKILEAPGVNAYTLPGNEFLLGKAKEAFDAAGNITNERTVQFLETCLDHFIKYVEVVSQLRKSGSSEAEDVGCSHLNATAIRGIDPASPDWLEEAAKQVNAVADNAYVKLDKGLLTVDQINLLLKALPFDLTYVDDHNQFLYCNKYQDPTTMLEEHVLGPVRERLSAMHGTLRHENQQYVRMLTLRTPDETLNVHNYQAMYHPDGSYAGLHEIAFNFKPWLDWYLDATGQCLVSSAKTAEHTDATSGASES